MWLFTIHELQHASLPCPSLSPGVCSNSYPLSQWYHPTISASVAPFSSSVFPSIRVFCNESALCIRWPSIGASASASVLPMNIWISTLTLISFRIDWFDLLPVQGTLKILLQHHSSKPPILWCSASFMVQISHPYMATGKTIDFTIWTFISKWLPCFLIHCLVLLIFPGGSDGKESVCNARDLGSIPGSGRCPGEGNGNPLQYSYLENPMERGV